MDADAQLGARPQLRERTAVGAVGDLASANPGALDTHSVPDDAVVDLGVGADATVSPDPRAPAHDRHRLEDGVLTDLDSELDVGRDRIGDRHAGAHQALQNAGAQGRLGPRQLDAVVDPDRLDRVVEAHDLDRLQQVEEARDVELATRVMRAVGVSSMVAGSRLVSAVNSGTILSFAGGSAPAAITASATQPTNIAMPKRFIVDLLNYSAEWYGQRLGPEQRLVAVDHQDVAVTEDLGGSLAERVAGALLLLLVDDFAAAVDVLGHLGLLWVEDDHDSLDAGPLAGLDREVDHGPAGKGVEDLGRSGAHAGAKTGG